MVFNIKTTIDTYAVHALLQPKAVACVLNCASPTVRTCDCLGLFSADLSPYA